MTKSEKIKAEIERMMKDLQQKKDALPITTETQIYRFSLVTRIAMCEELLLYINELPEDEPQPIHVPFVQIHDDCQAKCWEPGGVCTNPHRDCIGCPKDWSREYKIYTTNKIEDNLTATSQDGCVPLGANDVTWSVGASLSDCVGAVMAADWYPYEDKKDIIKWLCDKFGKTEDEILGVNDNEKEEQ